MSVLQSEYETMIIIRPDLDDGDTNAIAEKLEKVIEENNGHLLIRDDWGKRKLAYTIKNHQKGHYMRLNHLAPFDLISELERNIRNEDRVLRFMTVLLSDSVDVPARLETAAAERKVRDERLDRERAESQERSRVAEEERARVEAQEKEYARAAEQYRAEIDASEQSSDDDGGEALAQSSDEPVAAAADAEPAIEAEAAPEAEAAAEAEAAPEAEAAEEAEPAADAKSEEDSEA